jgi:hypothetical protein
MSGGLKIRRKKPSGGGGDISEKVRKAVTDVELKTKALQDAQAKKLDANEIEKRRQELQNAVDVMSAETYNAANPTGPQITPEQVRKIMGDAAPKAESTGSQNNVSLDSTNAAVAAATKEMNAKLTALEKTYADAQAKWTADTEATMTRLKAAFGEKALNDAMNKEMGSTRWQRTKEFLTKNWWKLGLGGGLFFLMAYSYMKRNSGCFLIQLDKGSKKCNASKDDDSCAGCGSSDETCKGQSGGKVCGICQCSSEADICRCIEMDYGAAMGGMIADTAAAAITAATSFSSILTDLLAYLPYILIGLGVLFGVRMIGSMWLGRETDFWGRPRTPQVTSTSVKK